jgi:hypothetical protein
MVPLAAPVGGISNASRLGIATTYVLKVLTEVNEFALGDPRTTWNGLTSSLVGSTGRVAIGYTVGALTCIAKLADTIFRRACCCISQFTVATIPGSYTCTTVL